MVGTRNNFLDSPKRLLFLFTSLFTILLMTNKTTFLSHFRSKEYSGKPLQKGMLVQKEAHIDKGSDGWWIIENDKKVAGPYESEAEAKHTLLEYEHGQETTRAMKSVKKTEENISLRPDPWSWFNVPKDKQQQWFDKLGITEKPTDWFSLSPETRRVLERQGFAKSKSLRRKDALTSLSGPNGGYITESTNGPVETEGFISCPACNGSFNCGTCGGTGVFGDGGPCPDCTGSGECICGGNGMPSKDVTDVSNHYKDVKRKSNVDCPQCGGSGEDKDSPYEDGGYNDCEMCGGSGIVNDAEKSIKGSNMRRKAKKDMEDIEDIETGLDEEVIVDKDEGLDDLPYIPKHSAKVLAKLYRHVKDASDYIDEEMKGSDLDHPGISEALTEHKESHIDPALEHLKSTLHEHHKGEEEIDPDGLMDKCMKSLETDGTGGGSTQPGEAGLVSTGNVPEEEPVEMDLEEEFTEDKSEVGSPEWEAEEAAEPEHKDDEDIEGAVDKDTEEILERYETPKGWKTRKAGIVRRAKNGKKYLMRRKDLEEDNHTIEEKYETGQPLGDTMQGPRNLNVREEGQAAAASGGSLADNPYPPGSPSAQYWTAGFNGTKSMRRKSDPDGPWDPNEDDDKPKPKAMDEDDETQKDVDETADFMEKLADEDDMPAKSRMGLKHHAKKLAWVGKSISIIRKSDPDGPWDPNEDDDKPKPKAVDDDEVEEKDALTEDEVEGLTKTVDEAEEFVKDVAEDEEVPKLYKAGLRKSAKRLNRVSKALTDQGKVQSNGGGGSALSNAGKLQRDGGTGSALSEEGDLEADTEAGKKRGEKIVGNGKPDTGKKLSSAVVREFMDLKKRFSMLTGIKRN